MEQDSINISLQSLPNKPGVYQFYDTHEEIIYIGKAKNLKKRVSSYFQKSHHDNGKVRILVRKINSIRHIVVESESDALLLENNLIKKYQPKYNIQLKDDKSFPWICIKNEYFPRVFSTRKLIKDGSQYFGPYTSVKMVHTLLDLIRKLYPLRNCNLDLNPDNIKKKNYKVCLEYHMGNCLAPCEEKQSVDAYNKTIQNIKHILKGNLQDVLVYLKKLMQEKASEFLFEEAQLLKEKIDLIEKYKSKSTIVNPAIHNLDVFGVLDDPKVAFVNFIKIINGAIIQSHTIEVVKKMGEEQDVFLPLVISELRERFNSNSKEILVPFKIENSLFKDVKFIVPKIGDKKKLLELSERNAKFFRLEKEKQKSIIAEKKSPNRILNKLKDDLNMDLLPVHIECFDNSNIQGSDPVAACVVFKNAKPAKKDYRHFNIKTVVGPDDFASMEEIVYRRYKRLLDEKSQLPQLIIIDGGKGQLSSAVKSLIKLGLLDAIKIIGIAKKLEEIYVPGDSIPLYIDKNSESLKLIQHLRNEAHRFGITHHRDKRSKRMIKSTLHEIPGIGDKLILKLYTHFESFDRLKSASLPEIEKAIGKAKAKIVYEYLLEN